MNKLVQYDSSDSDSEPEQVSKKPKIQSNTAKDSVLSFLSEPVKPAKKSNRVLGGAIKNQYNSSSILVGGIDIKPVDESVKLSFLPSSLSRKQKTRTVAKEAVTKNDLALNDKLLFPEIKEITIKKPVVGAVLLGPEEKSESTHKNIIEFNVNDFYKANSLTESQSLDPSATLKTYNAHGKNQLSSLIKYANDSKDLLSEKFHSERSNKKKRDQRYGW